MNSAIIVLGNTLVDDTTMSGILQSRLKKALHMHIKFGCDIIVSGGNPNKNKHSEAHLMKAWLIKNGVNEKNIIKENKSMDTRDNLYYSNKLLVEHNKTKVVIVSSPSHLIKVKGITKDLISSDIEVCFIPSTL